MEFKNGTEVKTVSGDKVGTVDRVVLDPKTDEVTHIVVRKGFLLPEDKVVRIEDLTDATEDTVTLRAGIDNLDDLPPYEERYYVPWEDVEDRAAAGTDSAAPYYWYPPAGAAWWGSPGYAGNYGYAPYLTPVQVVHNIPENTIALKEGAKVYSTDGDHVGNVERLFVSADDRVSHFVISEGLIFKTKKLVPTSWVMDVTEDEVYLSVKSSVLDRLEAYEA
ncbi:PRC-barrel domain-containing protein [Aggregatilinea lenta]|uniref:PRC-barrel domain-containing protein n=1 Tax=Aggregatilinea lenta TaxID=913108 RepID=UPI0013C2E688|nr:PRC-barrel domain-containing protein [Aggregatilinea lenta]